MIVITREAIEHVLDETISLNSKGRLTQHRLELENRLKKRDPLLIEYIKTGTSLFRLRPEPINKFLAAGYKCGSYMTYLMLEAQAHLEKTPLPVTTLDDIKKMNESGRWMMDYYDYGARSEGPKIKELQRIRQDNKDFGKYAIGYVQGAAFNETVGEGFAVGVITTYGIYEKAFRRQAA